jgi:hypothetical protein
MEKGHIDFKPYAPMDLQTVFELQVTAEKMYDALQVLLKSEKLKCLLEVNDKKAYEQAKLAVEDYEYKLFHI